MRIGGGVLVEIPLRTDQDAYKAGASTVIALHQVVSRLQKAIIQKGDKVFDNPFCCRSIESIKYSTLLGKLLRELH